MIRNYNVLIFKFCAINLYLFKAEDIQIEKYIEHLHQKNEDRNTASRSTYKANISNRYACISAKMHENHTCNVVKMIKAVINTSSSSLKSSKYNIYYSYMSEENFYNEKNSFAHIMQIFSLFFSNLENKHEHNQETQFIDFYHEAVIIAEVDNLKILNPNVFYNFYLVENCLKTEKDIFFVYNVISKMHKITSFNPFDLNIIIALNCEQNAHKIFNFKFIDTKKLELTFAECKIIDGTYAEIAMQNDFCQEQKNQKECNIGRSYRYNKLNKKFYHVNDIHCGNNVKHHKLCFSLNNRIKIIFMKYIEDMKNIIAFEETNIYESKNTIILKTYKEKYIFFFFIQIKKKEFLNEQNIKGFFLIKTISIYYIHNGRVKIYGRYSYEDEYVYEDNKAKVQKILVSNTVTKQKLFSEFKNQLDILSDYKFSLLSDFLPTKKCFLNFVNYPHWFNCHNTYPFVKFNPKNINLANLKNFLNAIKKKYSLISEIILFDARIIKTYNYINLAYKENLFNVVEICNELKITNLNDEFLRNICVLIILLVQKGTKGIKSNYFIFLPIREYDLFLKIFDLNKLFIDLFSINKFAKHLNRKRMKKAFLYASEVSRNVIFNLPNKYVSDFINLNSLDHIVCENRVLLYFFYTNLEKHKHLFHNYEHVKFIYQKFRQNLYTELDLIRHESFLVIKTFIYGLPASKKAFDVILVQLHDIYKLYKFGVQAFFDKSQYCIYQVKTMTPSLNTKDLYEVLYTHFT
ncbi:hypothetical protein COBT_000511 [Conglomerata obtusa]